MNNYYTVITQYEMFYRPFKITFESQQDITCLLVSHAQSELKEQKFRAQNLDNILPTFQNPQKKTIFTVRTQ